MSLIPVEENLFKIFKRRKHDYQQIAGMKIEPNVIADRLLAEGFAKESVVRFKEHLIRMEQEMQISRLTGGTIIPSRIWEGI